MLASVITSLSMQIEPARYINIGITKVFIIWIRPMIVRFHHFHNWSFVLIAPIVSMKLSFCLRGRLYVKYTPRIFTASLISMFTVFRSWMGAIIEFPRSKISVLSKFIIRPVTFSNFLTASRNTLRNSSFLKNAVKSLMCLWCYYDVILERAQQSSTKKGNICLQLSSIRSVVYLFIQLLKYF